MRRRELVYESTPLEQLPHLLTTEEVAVLAGRHVASVYRAVADGKLPKPQAALHRREDVLRWLGLLESQLRGKD